MRAMAGGPSNRRHGEVPIAEFWAWFVRHANALANSHPESVLRAELLAAVQRVDPKLYFELGANADGHELIVTAEGRRELFALVEALIADAPSLAEWTFVALKPAMGFDFRTSYEGVVFDARSIWFLPLESQADRAALGVRIGVPDFERAPERITKNAIGVILDTALGERAAAELQRVEIAALPANPAEHGFLELAELADYIAWRKRKLASHFQSIEAPRE